jgi:hypothetical protein
MAGTGTPDASLQAEDLRLAEQAGIKRASLLHIDVGLGRIGHAGTDLETHVGRLVVR